MCQLERCPLISPLAPKSCIVFTVEKFTMQGYQGWANWETWNVALWIGNDESLYHQARECANYQELVNILWECGSKETPDGARWDDIKVDGLAICEMMKDL